MNIKRKRVDLDTRCLMCYRLDEDGGHLFLKCKKAKHLWRAMLMEEVRLAQCEAQTTVRMLEILCKLEPQKQIEAAIICWDWWNAMNKVNAGDREMTTDELVHVVQKHVMEFKVKMVQKPPQIRLLASWTKPKENFTEENFDAAFRKESGTGAWGFIARMDEGDCVVAAMGKLSNLKDPLHAEAEICIAAVEGAANLGLHRVIFESDSLTLVNAINTGSHDLAEI